LSFSVRPGGDFLAAAAVASLACGCAASPPYDAVTTHNTRFVIEPGGDHKVQLHVDGKPPQPIPGLTSAQIDVVWSAVKSDFVVLHGASADCPQSTWLATIADGYASLHALGSCHDRLTLTEDGDKLLIRQVPPQGGPIVVAYRDGDSIAHVLPPDATPRRRGVATSRVKPMQDRQPVGEADTLATTDQPSPTVPAVSAPVGEDVLPAPVGAGPLPSGASTLVPPFAATPPSK
jgi:hypothetical protein